MLIDLGLVLISGAVCFYLGRKTRVLPFLRPSAETNAAWERIRANAETNAAWQKTK